MGVMLRFGGVSVPQSELESELGCPVQWARESGDGLHHAQIDALPHSGHVDWMAIEEFLDIFGDRIAGLIRRGAVAAAELDIGLPFHKGNLMASVTVPGSVCLHAGSRRVAVTVTYYATSEENERSARKKGH